MQLLMGIVIGMVLSAVCVSAHSGVWFGQRSPC